MQVTHQPPKELIIHKLYKVSKEELAKTAITESQGRGPIYWHYGIAFFFVSFPMLMNTEIISDFMKGKEHWVEVYYADMDTIKEEIELEDGDFKGAKIRVMNAGSFSPHKEFAEWAKTLK